MKTRSLLPAAWLNANFMLDRNAAKQPNAAVKTARPFSPLLSHTETQSLFDEAFHALAHEMGGGSAHDAGQEQPQC